MNARYLPLLAGAMSLTGCMIESTGPTQHDFRAIDRDSAELVRVNLNMGAGNLRVSSGTEKLARVDFSYNIPFWKPEARYRNAAGRGTLDIEQPHGIGHHGGSTKYEWDLRLNRDVPIELNVHFGAGEANLFRGMPDHPWRASLRATVRASGDSPDICGRSRCAWHPRREHAWQRS